jgi:hypothetical protein
MAKIRDFSSQKVEKKGGKTSQSEAEIQIVCEVPKTKALSGQKFFPLQHRDSTKRDPEQQLQNSGQRRPGSWAKACEGEHHSGGWPPGCEGRWREKAGPQQRLRNERLWGTAGKTEVKLYGHVSIRNLATAPSNPSVS